MELTDQVCPQCGTPVAQAQRFCMSCGLSLAAHGELPTAAEWQARRGALASPSAGAAETTVVIPPATGSAPNGSGLATGDHAADGGRVASAPRPLVSGPGLRGANAQPPPPPLGQPPTPQGSPRHRRWWLVAMAIAAAALSAGVAAALVLSNTHSVSSHPQTHSQTLPRHLSGVPAPGRFRRSLPQLSPAWSRSRRTRVMAPPFREPGF